ncbi:MAG: hypothetical protein L6R42_000773 [Xanthoria sp. 1 TBL-2021]|nr:MAG: hypothetical protein L6R42_000773 [Xanthoria sp. 1 TBL-2021]
MKPLANLHPRSKIDKLSIRGIRSFDNAQPEVIQFFTPLTLIVGDNGSGKTTIIESLKYATTGEMPPNAKQGGAFIHDPKLCGEKEVLAQVKLQFKDPSGAKVVVTRNVSLTVQKTKRTMKTLDGSLLRQANGERTVMSSRNAELDRFIPQYLGVSKAVLENVIFCHQDESLWPMSEPGTLKKKFDEIFEALKYTKAIDAIKKMKKDYTEELRRLHIAEQYCKNNKIKADKASKESSVLSDEIEGLRVELEKLDKVTKEANEKYQDAFNRSSKFDTLHGLLENKRTEQEFLRDQMENLADGLKIRPESDASLQNELDQYDERVRLRKDQEQKQSNKFAELGRVVETIRDRLQHKYTEAGKYEQQQASHDQNVESRKNTIRESAVRHNIRGYEGDLDDMQINEYMQKVSRLYRDQTEKVEQARRETEKETQKVQGLLNKLGERRSGLQEQISSTKQQSSANDRRIGSIQSELESIDVDEGAEALSKSKVQDIEDDLKQAKEKFKKSSWDTKINDVKIQLRKVDDELERTNQELLQGTKQSNDLARLDLLKKDLNDGKRSLETLTGAHKDRLQAIIRDDWNIASLERDFQSELHRRSTALQDARDRQNTSSRDLNQAEAKLDSHKNELHKAEKELQNCADIIKTATQEAPDTYLAQLDGILRDRDTLRKDVDDFDLFQEFYRKSLHTAEAKGSCELCKQKFHSEPERSDFMKRMQKKMEDDTKKEQERKLKAVEEDLKNWRSVGPKHSFWLHQSGTEIPRLRSEIRRLEASKAILVQKSENCDREVADLKESSDDAESLTKPVASIVRFQTDISQITEQIKELSAEKKDAGMARSIEEIQEQLENLNAQTRSKNKLLYKITGEKQQALSDIQAKELALSRAREDFGTATHQLEKKSRLLKQIEDLRKSNRESRDTVRRLDDEIQQVRPQVSEQDAKLEDIRNRGYKKEQELNQEATRLSESLQKLSTTDQNIQAYTKSRGPLRLSRCQQEIQDIRQEIEKTEAEQKETIKEINAIKEELGNHKESQRTIKNNLTYRKAKRDLEAVDKEVSRLSAEEAETDAERLKEKVRHWKNQYNKHSTETTSRLATMKAKDDQLKKLLEDWHTDYENAAHEYKEAHIKVETTKAAVEDLGRYGSALDKAIMQYHSLKMEEINRIAEELWKKTYQGTDIDTILIRSDGETGKANRSYNYRVCMVKQEAEMDMRGRCSAGQRVLASIIIRLALAECFGVKCGLIALDEPTTNLDRDNIRSLAESLHDIIRARQQQSNFQLIVITHDEEFLRYMQCADFCDTYFRISRTDRQKSKIEQESVTELVG